MKKIKTKIHFPIWLLIILSLLAVISFVVALPFSYNEFFLNLGIELLMIIFAIYIIDNYLKKLEKSKWEGSWKIYAFRVFRISNLVISTLAELLELESEIFLEYDQSNSDNFLNHFLDHRTKNINNVDENLIFDRLFSFDTDSFLKLKKELDLIINGFPTILINEDIYDNALDFEIILSLREDLEKTISSIETVYPFTSYHNSHANNSSNKFETYRKIFIIELGLRIGNLLKKTNEISTKFYTPDCKISGISEDVDEKFKNYMKWKSKKVDN